MRRARSRAAASLTRAAVAVMLGLVAIFGSLILGSFGVGPSASAEGPASVFYGYVFADGESGLPERVRAIGPSGASCGTAEVLRLNTAVGYYAISVASSSEKNGCPTPDGVVQFALLMGRVDDGARAGSVAILSQDAGPRALNLRAAVAVSGPWFGEPGSIERDTWLRWSGDTTSLVKALGSLPLTANTIYMLDPASGVPVEVVSPDEVSLTTGQLLLVRFN